MKTKIYAALFWASALFGGASASAQAEDAKTATAPGAKLEKLADGFAFTEGPACDAEGSVFFTDQPNNRILKWSAAGVLSTFLQNCGRSNGLAFDESGALWACADDKNELWRISKDGSHEVAASGFGGKLLNGPNDVWPRPANSGGGVFVSDPFYKRDYWARGGPEQDSQGVYFLAAGSKYLRRVAADLKQANGLIGTPDGKILYVADIGASKTYSYAIAPDGSLSDRKLFCEMGSDGLTIDDAGNVYLTGKGVTIFDKSGQQIEHIDVAEDWTSNACFGGADRRSLFVTASHGLYKIAMRTRGVGSQ